MYNPTNLPDKFIRDLLWAAGDRRNGLEISGVRARQLLEHFGIDWYPEAKKLKGRDDALREFKRDRT